MTGAGLVGGHRLVGGPGVFAARTLAGYLAAGCLAAGCLAAAFAVAGLLAAPAQAGFGPIEAQSLTATEQAEFAGEPAISADGRYLAFVGAIGGVEGVLRKNLATGRIELVAGGSIYGGASSVAREAHAPSISANGQYVSFTSEAPLVAAAHSGSNVYVRNMAIDPGLEGPCSESLEKAGLCPYELASARNESSEGIAYESEGGAVASGRVSLSANGREIAFVIEGGSDLQTAGTLSTPPGQVVVRYLDRHETALVSAERDPSTGQMTNNPVQGGAVTRTTEFGTETSTASQRGVMGAALSADGSTVAWLGANIPAQAPTLEGERQKIERDDQTPEPYDEPLWRRIGDGPGAPTRRMVGGGDPLAPGCPADGTISDPACQGPYPTLPWDDPRGGKGSYYGWLGITGYDGVPQLSADGWTAALIGDPDSTSNVFLVNMQEGLDRVQALRQLTREVPVSEYQDPGADSAYVPQAGNIYEAAISPDGSRIAFTTQRQQFPLAPPYDVEPPPNQVGNVELYQIDLDNESLVRVTHGPDDGPSLGAVNGGIPSPAGAANPSYTADDLTLAFADGASNLVFGDDNAASDVFTTHYEPAPEVAGPVQIGAPPPGNEPAAAQWRLSVVPLVHADGSCTLEVLVPAAGRLTAQAQGVVPVAVKVSPASRKAGAARKRHSGRRRGQARAQIALRSENVATASTTAAAPGLIALPLSVTPRYRPSLQSKAGIYATVTVRFTAPGGSSLSQTVVVSLHGRRATRRRGR
jgi:Tol biopolymer transport system component